MRNLTEEEKGSFANEAIVKLEGIRIEEGKNEITVQRGYKVIKAFKDMDNNVLFINPMNGEKVRHDFIAPHNMNIIKNVCILMLID